MQELYFCLAAVHIVSLVVTGILWTAIDIKVWPVLKSNLRDIRAVHFGSLYLVPWLLGLAWAFERLRVPSFHQAFFPTGLAALVFFSGIAYLFPKPPGLDPFYYWTRGKAMYVSGIGLAIFVICLLWTAGVLVWYSVNPGHV